MIIYVSFVLYGKETRIATILVVLSTSAYSPSKGVYFHMKKVFLYWVSYLTSFDLTSCRDVESGFNFLFHGGFRSISLLFSSFVGVSVSMALCCASAVCPYISPSVTP